MAMKEEVRVPRHFAAALRAGRMAVGKPLALVAREAGLPTWRLGKFERGDEIPTAEEFGRVWCVLSTSER